LDLYANGFIENIKDANVENVPIMPGRDIKIKNIDTQFTSSKEECIINLTKTGLIFLHYNIGYKKFLELNKIKNTVLESMLIRNYTNLNLIHALCLEKKLGAIVLVDKLLKSKLKGRKIRLIDKIKIEAGFVDIKTSKGIDVELYVVNIEMELVLFECGRDEFVYPLKNKGVLNFVVSEREFFNVEEMVFNCI
jgi:hypothetical protein